VNVGKSAVGECDLPTPSVPPVFCRRRYEYWKKEKEIAGNEDDSEGDARIVSVEVMRIGYTGFRKSIGRRGLCFTADPDSTTSTQS